MVGFDSFGTWTLSLILFPPSFLVHEHYKTTNHLQIVEVCIFFLPNVNNKKENINVNYNLQQQF
jgi:hypothetical protein